MSSPDNGGAGGSGGVGNTPSTSGTQSNTVTTVTGPNVTGDKSNPMIKQNTFPIDLAPKIALVKPTDGKGGTVQTHQFRTLTQQPMRMVIPSGAVQTTGTAHQIMQTHLMPQALIKQVDALGRTQITALPSRSMAQSSSMTVTRPLTPNTFMPRGVTTVTNISGARGAIRAQTPPISTNISTGFVRGTIPPRTPSPAAGTVIPSGTTWISGNQPVQLLRANIGHTQRTRIVQPNMPTATVSASNTGSISVSQISQPVSQSGTIQTVSSGGAGGAGGNQQFVATLSTVLPQRQQTATLVYSNAPQQLGTTAGGQRLAVGQPITAQRQVRPMGVQIGGARLPATGMGVRVSNGNINIRGATIPNLAPSGVLSTLPTGTSTTVTASNLQTVAGLSNARIIQVQQQNAGGPAQVLSTTGRITGNLMTLHPLMAASGTAVRGTATTARPSLTITHVGNERTMTVNHQRTVNDRPNISQQTITSSTIAHTHQQQSPQQQQHQITQIVNLNQPGINVGHQIQIIGSQGAQQSSTVVPLTITSRAGNPSVNSLPVSVPQIVRTNVNLVSSGAGNSGSGMPPVAKVLPQQQKQQHSNEAPPPIVSVSSSQNIRVSQHQHQQFQQTITTNVSSANVPISVSYAPQAGPFAVVPSSNRATILSGSAGGQGNQVPVRFNPPLIVDSNKHQPKQMQQIHAQPSQQQMQLQQHQIQTSSTSHQQAKPTHMLLPMANTKTPGIIATPRAQQSIVSAPVSSAPSALTKSAVKNLNPTLNAISSESLANLHGQRADSPTNSRPGSTDGSTTVSATSSPGLDQQEQEELNALSAMHRNNRNIGDGAHFKNVDNLFAIGQTVNVPQMQANSSAYGHSAPHNIVTSFAQATSSSMSSTTMASVHASAATTMQPNKSNGNTEQLTPRKRARKQQLSEYAGPQNTKKYHVSGSSTQTADSSTGGGSVDSDGNPFSGNASNASSSHVGGMAANKNVVDATPKQIDYIIKKPRTCTLLDSYKQTWKGTNNHFQRYSDVKPRDDRRPSLTDMVNQSHVLQKINGWRVYHLSSQMEDLTELESQVYDRLSSMLQCMEAHNQSSDVDRVNELIKGNMQRSKIVSDSINDARAQIMKVFEHKAPVSDIIHRCASKRNLKKREKS